MSAPDEHMTPEQLALAIVAGRQIVRIARMFMGDELGLVSAAIIGALSSVVAAAEDPGAMLDATIKILEDSRPAILQLHVRIQAELAAVAAPADGLAS